MDTKQIEKNFQQIRKEKGLSWAELAARAGVKNYQTILNPLRQGKTVTLATLEKLAALLCVDFRELLADETHQGPEAKNVFRCPICGAAIQVTAADKTGNGND